MSAGPVRVRPPAVAGTFYPADPGALARVVDAAVARADAGEGPAGAVRPDAVVVPHAGYAYSGPIAASAYARLAAWRGTSPRIVLIGPAHFVPVQGVATTSADAFATPLGRVPVDGALREAALAAGAVVDDRAHAPEHSLEVQLPFLQRVVGDYSVLPLVVGREPPDEVARVLDAVWTPPDVLLVVSTDLSHYLDADTARRRDAATARAIEAGDVDAIHPFDACGAAAVRGAVMVAARRGLRFSLLDLRNSGDTGGDPDRVVGYGAFASERRA